HRPADSRFQPWHGAYHRHFLYFRRARTRLRPDADPGRAGRGGAYQHAGQPERGVRQRRTDTFLRPARFLRRRPVGAGPRPHGLVSGYPAAERHMSGLLTLAQARAACQSEFLVAAQGAAGGIRVPLHLESVSESRVRSGYVQFALLFTGPAQQPLAQATFLLGHAVLGELPVFLVPVGQRGELIEYQAIFSYPETPENNEPG